MDIKARNEKIDYQLKRVNTLVNKVKEDFKNTDKKIDKIEIEVRILNQQL